MQTYMYMYICTYLHKTSVAGKPTCGTDGKSQDVPGHPGTKGIWLTWDLHVRYPQCESTVKRKCQRCTHFTYNHVRPACVQREYYSWAAPASYFKPLSLQCYDPAVHIHVHVHVYYKLCMYMYTVHVHVHVYYILCM